MPVRITPHLFTCIFIFTLRNLILNDSAASALKLNPNYVKAYFRRALAYLSILQPKSALVDFKKVVALEPGNTAGKAQLDNVQKLVRRMEFEKAYDLIYLHVID